MSDDSKATQGGDNADDDQDVTGAEGGTMDADDQNADTGDAQGDSDDDDAPLGPKGEKALAAEKEKRRKESERRRAAEAELAKLRNKDSSEVDQARTEAETAALAKANTRILKAEVRAAAAGKLADPSDALKLLDLTQFEVDGDGEVDRDEIGSAIDTLLKSKPYLAAATNGKRFQGSGDGGARGKTPSLDQQIIAAEQKSDWTTARQLKSMKLAEIRSKK